MAGGSSTISNEQPALGSLQVQTSSYGLATPLIWGRTKVSGNLLWYGDFTAIKHVEETSSGGKGGGGGVTQQNITYTYQAAVMVSICAGPINGITRAWKAKSVLDGATSPLSYRIVTYTERFTVPSGGVVTVAHAATFSRNVAVRDQGNDDAGGSAGVLIESVDYTRSGGTYTFVAGFVGAELDVQYQSLESGYSTPSALPQLGVNLATGTLGQPTWSYLTGRHPSDAFGYSGLAYVYADKYDLSSGAQLDNHVFEVSTPSEFGGGIVDANMAVVMEEFLTDGQRGCLWPAAKLGDMMAYRSYCISHGLFMSPALQEQQAASDIVQHWLDITNSDCVYSGLQLKIVPLGDESKTAHGATYTANTTPAYDLTVDDLIVEDGSLPVTITPRLNEDAFNHVRIEYLNRDNGYNVDIAAAKDQAHIEEFGERLGDPIQCHEITTSEVAAFAAQMELQRQMSLWNTYSFRLPWTKGRLEPAVDLVTLTVPDQYLFRVPVRITKMVEAGQDAFDVEAEDCPFGHASAPLYGQQAGSGYQPQYNEPPPSVDDAVFFEAPAALAAGGTGLEIWGAIASPGDNWGGANVWVSLDGVSYRQVARQVGASRIGTLTSGIAGGLLQLHGVTGQLVGASAEDTAALATLSIVLGSQPEYLAYEGATLLGDGAYTLSGLVRGAYGSPATSHASGDRFVRIDGSIVRSGGLDALYIGKTIYFKFTSFNLYGSAEQGLAEVDPMPYVVTGAFAQASPGTAGRGLVLKATAQAIKQALSGVRSPAAVTLTAELRGTLQGTPTWSVVSGAATLSGSGLQRTVDTSTITSPAQIQVQLVDEIGTYTDQVTLTVVADGATGADGNKFAQAVLYQWAAVQPTAPNGTSTWTWATATQSSYTGGNGWQIGIPANPGNAGLKLWSATQQISAPGSTASTTVSWAAGAALAAVGQNGAGVQTAEVAVYAWALNLASLPALTGTATYTWASGSLSSVPSGWSATPGSTATAGQTLYKAALRLQDASTSPTTSVNYTSFGTSAVGYAGLPGSAGSAGASYRIAYAKVTGATIGSGTVTTAGSSSFPPANSWGRGETWGGTVPTFAANESVMQTNGVYDPTTGNTVWGSPYLASWRVGKLSAITADIGDITAGSLNIGGGKFQVSSSGYLVAYGAQLLDESGNVIFSTRTGATAALPSSWVTPDASWLNSNVPIPAGTMNADPGLLAWENSWELPAGISVAGPSVAPGAPAGKYFSAYSPTDRIAWSKQTYPLDANHVYSFFSALYAEAGNNRNMYLVVDMFTASGTHIANAGWGGTLTGYVFGGLPATGVWTRYGSDFGAGTARPIPATAAYCKIGVWFQYSGSGSSAVQQAASDIRLLDVTDARAASKAAADAQDAADAAQDDADEANAQLADYASDGKLTPLEKQALRKEWNSIIGAWSGIDAQAAAMAITTERTGHNTTLTALGTYLNGGTAWVISSTPPLWLSDAQLSVTTNVVGATLRANWKAYTDARQALLTKIAAIAATTASWDSISDIPYETIVSNDDSVSLGFNPTFAWPASSGYPTNWSNWTGAAPERETAVTIGSATSVKFSGVAGGQRGMLHLTNLTSSPLPAGTFLVGNVSMYLAAYTSGKPGLLVRLYTNSALTTYVDTTVPAPSTTVGSWQRVPWTARAGGAAIYGVAIYLMASWPTMPGGVFTGSVVFSTLRFMLADSTTDNTTVTISSSGALSGGGGGQVTITGLGYTGALNATNGATIGTNLAGNFTQTTFDVVMAGQTLIRSLHIQDLRTTNYAEDGSGNPTAGAKLASAGTALKVANQSLQIGTAIFTDYWARLVQGIDGANGTAILWRGNNDASTRGGAPNIDCLSMVTQFDQLVQSNFQETFLSYTLTPTSYTSYSDNLDAMTQIHVAFFATSTSSTPFTECYQPMASRVFDGASGIARGSLIWGWRYTGTGSAPGVVGDHETNNAYDAYIRVRIANTYGWSATKDLYGGGTSAAVGRTMTATTITGSSGSSGGGGGAVGGGCPAPWVKVRLQNGIEVEASALYNGARVAAVDDQTLEAIPDGGVVADLRTIWKIRYRVRLTSGEAYEFSEGHRLGVADRGWVEVEKIRPGDHIVGLAEAIVESCIATGMGQVISFLVKGAGTYFAGGLLSHNLKMLP